MKTLVQSTMMLILFSVLTGILYPALVTVVAQFAWPDKSNGSLIREGQTIRGSHLVAQKFQSDRYFWPRPSASDFLLLPSSATNLGPTSKELKEAIQKRRRDMSLRHESSERAVPEDLLTSSASGIDPHISPAACRYQISRIVKARALSATQKTNLESIVNEHLEKSQWGLFGEARVNVLDLNMALDGAFSGSQ